MNNLLDALRAACPCGDHAPHHRHADTRPRCTTCGHDHAQRLHGQPCLTCDCDRRPQAR